MKTLKNANSSETARFQFSVIELMIAMSTVAMILGLMRLTGDPSSTATILGFVSLTGLAVHALGFAPPCYLVLGWWLTLMLYVLLSIMAAAFPSLS
jgi:hypothetical protein